MSLSVNLKEIHLLHLKQNYYEVLFLANYSDFLPVFIAFLSIEFIFPTLKCVQLHIQFSIYLC